MPAPDAPVAPRPASSPGLLLAWIGVLLAILMMALFAGTYATTTNTVVRILGQVITVAAFGAWVTAAARNAWWTPRRLLLGPGLVALAGIAVSSAFSPEPRLAFGGLLVAACSLAAFLLLDRLAAHPFFRPRLRALVVAAAIGLPIVYVVQVALVWVEWWGMIGQVAVPPLRPGWAGLTLGSPNLVASVLLVVVPVALATIWTGTSPAARRAVAVAVTAGLGVVALMLTGSRGGMLGLAAATVVGGVLAVIRSGRLSRRVALAGSVAVLALGLVGLVVIVARGAQGGEDLRVELWRTAMVVFADHPLSGGGPDTWALLKLTEAQPGAITFVVAHAHNLYVWTLAELGIVGTAGVLVFAGVVLVQLARRSRSRDARTSAAAIGAVSALAGIAAQSLVDVVTNLPGIVVLIALVVAQALADEEDPLVVGRPGRWFRPAVVLAGIGVVAMAVAFVRVDQGMAAAAQARVLLLDGDAAGAQARFAEARAIDPHPLYRNEQALAAAFAGDEATALPLAEATVAHDGLAHHRILLGYRYLEVGDRTGALASAQAAMDMGWADPGVFLNASRIAEIARDERLSREALVQAAALAPASLDDPYWQGEDRMMPYEELVQAAADLALDAGDDGRAALILAHIDDPRVPELLAGVPDGTRPRVAALITARDDPDAAIAVLRASLAANPSDWVTAAQLAWVEIAHGLEGEARLHARWAAIVQSDSATAAYSMPRVIGDSMALPQFRLGGDYPLPVYEQAGSGLLFGPGSVTVVP